jgi:hypothetical protein
MKTRIKNPKILYLYNYKKRTQTKNLVKTTMKQSLNQKITSESFFSFFLSVLLFFSQEVEPIKDSAEVKVDSYTEKINFILGLLA